MQTKTETIGRETEREQERDREWYKQKQILTHAE